MCIQKNNYICNSVTCSCKNGKYVEIIIDDLVTTCNEVIEEAETIRIKTVLTKANVFQQKLFQQKLL